MYAYLTSVATRLGYTFSALRYVCSFTHLFRDATAWPAQVAKHSCMAGIAHSPTHYTRTATTTSAPTIASAASMSQSLQNYDHFKIRATLRVHSHEKAASQAQTAGDKRKRLRMTSNNRRRTISQRQRRGRNNPMSLGTVRVWRRATHWNCVQSIRQSRPLVGQLDSLFEMGAPGECGLIER